MTKPDFFIVGAPKCGTTSFCDYLSQHPDIYISNPKEIHYFSHDLIQPIEYAKYTELFKGNESKKCGEGSVWYLYSEVAAKEIKKHNPSAKIIIMLREPVSFIQAVHYENLLCSNENIQSFEEAWRVEKLRRDGHRIPKTPNRPVQPKFYFYRDILKFHTQVKRYISVFGEENVHIVLFDDINKNTPKVYKEMLSFLEVDHEFQANFEILNQSSRIKNVKAYSFLRNPPTWLFKLGNMVTPPFMKKFRRKLGWSAINYAKSKLVETQKRPQISAQLQAEIKDFIQPEIEQLSNLINRDLSTWY